MNRPTDAIRDVIYRASNISYEFAEGVHTYHQCQYCKQRATRAGMCWMCLTKELLTDLDAALDAYMEATGECE